MSKLYTDHGIKIKSEYDPYDKDLQSSKTILISNVDRVNICINNHYTDSNKKSVTDTTKSCSIKNYHNFKSSQDVLAKQADGCFFLGTIIDIESTLCLVKFGDNTERWFSVNDLKSLGSDSTDDSPICVVCKEIKTDVKVDVCETCGRGYHKKCTHGYREDNGAWHCKRCTQAKTKSLKKTTLVKKVKKEELSLPYDLKKQQWDQKHRSNQQKTYCYCGKNGDWLKQMLQCNRCQQWFHEKCISSIQYPLYDGDRFYVFVCSVCNFGPEFLRRLEMSWPEIVRLLIYNLSTHSSTEYFDLHKVIIPYAIDNWNNLQLSSNMKNLSRFKISENIARVIKKSDYNFKYETNLGYKNDRRIPNCLKIDLPKGFPVTEQYLRENWDKLKISFIPQSPAIKVSYDKDAMREIIAGKAYQPTSTSDTESRLSDIELKISSSDDDDGSRKSSDVKLVKNEITVIDISDSSNDTSSRGTFDLIIPPPIDFQGSCFKKVDDNVTSSTKVTSTVSEKSKKEKPLSVDPLAIDEKATPSKLWCFEPTTTPTVVTSSVVTPTLLIPSKTMIKNELVTSTVPETVSSTSSNSVSDKSDTPVAPLYRIVNRQLSAKDIIIGPNNEVKRRKVSRKRSSFQVQPSAKKFTTTTNKDWPVSSVFPSTSSSTSSNNSQEMKLPSNYKPTPPPAKTTSGGRRLRTRIEKNYSERRKSGSANTSTFNLPGISTSDDIKELQLWFGTPNRIANGENFTVNGKRVLTDGRVQTLIEWD